MLCCDMVTKCLTTEYLAYEGISKSSWSELIEEYMVTFVIGHCPSLCSESSFFATAKSTAGTDILESHVRQQLFQGQLDSVAL
jgi:hypothetical protein